MAGQARQTDEFANHTQEQDGSMFATTTTTTTRTGTTATAGAGAAAGATINGKPPAATDSDRNGELLDERGAAGAGEGGSERRRSTREPLITRGTLKAVTGLASEPPLEVLVVDVSLHGVGLRSAESLEVGDLYHVEIGAGPLHLTSRARIVRCRLRRDGNFDIGAEFC